MGRTRPFSLIASLGALALLASCSGASDPVTNPEPASQAAPLPTQVDARPLPEGTALVGALNLHVAGGGEPSASIDPVRVVGAVGDTFNEVGLTPTMNGGTCDCFDVAGIRLLDADTVRVTFDIRHPFSATFRPDLHAFNLKAHVESFPATTINGLYVDPGLVANADGYSGLWRSQVTGTTSDIFPYVILTRDLSSQPFDFRAPTGWNVFAAGGSYQADLDLNLPPGGDLDLRLYLTVDYGQSAVRATRQSPLYELPKFAGKAPWKVTVTELSNGLEGGNAASSAQYKVQVYDWGHGASLGTDVTGGTISVSTLGFSAALPAFTGTGFDTTPLEADVLVVNTGGGPAGNHYGLVTITDQAATGIGISDDLVSSFTVSDYSTYQVFPVTVIDIPTSDPPVAIIAAPCSGQSIATGRTITFDGSSSTDDVTPPASLIYEWDFDYDGSTFDVDATGDVVTHDFTVAGTPTVALRVTDGEGQPNIATALLNVAVPVWRNLRNVTNSPAVNDSMENQIGDFGRRMFIDSIGEAHLIYRATGNMLMANLGLACTGSVVTITDLGISRPPSAAQAGDTLQLAYVSASLTSIEYRTVDMLTRTLGSVETVLTAASLPSPGGANFNAARIARDKTSGNQWVIGETNFGYDLFSAERAPAGTWSAPVLIDNRGATNFSSYMGAGATANECFVIYHDYITGSSGQRRAYYSRKPFGAPTWTSRVWTGFPDGAHLCFWIWEGPGDDLLGGNFMNPSGSGAQAFYLRWSNTSQSWSRAQLSNLYNYNFFPNILLDPRTNEVTAVWEHLDQSTLNKRRIVSKKFAYDAPAATIADGTYTLVYESATFDNNEPVAAINPVTGDIIAAWEQDMDAGAPYLSDLWSMEF